MRLIMKMMTAETQKRALMLVNRPSVINVYAYLKRPIKNKIKLTGKNTRIGEYKVAIRVMIIKNRMPS
jgi:hypothetical protein